MQDTHQDVRRSSQGRRADVFPTLSPAEAETPVDPQKAENDLLASVLAQTTEVAAPKAAPKAKPTPRVAAKPAALDLPKPGVTWSLPGFEGKCRVTTNFGDLPIQALRRRDKVRVQSGGFREVLWVDELRLDADFMSRHDAAQPILIRARALGANLPGQNMLVSPAQAVTFTDPAGTRRKSLAIDLLDRPGISRQHRAEITYYRFHVGSPEQVCIEGGYFTVSPPA